VAGPVRIRRAKPGDSAGLAALHCREIPWGLLAQLGVEFVTLFYQTLVVSPLGFAFVAEGEGGLVGFAGGVVRWRPFYVEFLRRHVIAAARAVVASLRRARWRRLLETTRYAASAALPPAELVAIAVAPEARGGGVAGDLVRHVLEEFARRGVGAVRVTAGPDNVRAGRLYEKLGFRLHAQVEIHPGQRAPVYVIALPAAAPPIAVS